MPSNPTPPSPESASSSGSGQTSLFLQPTASGQPPAAAPQVRFLTGYVTVRMGFCTVHQVKEALEIQKRSVPRPHLGAVLNELGYLTARELTDEVLFVLNTVKVGNVTREKIEEAIDIRNRSTPRSPLSEVLVAMGCAAPKPVVNPNRFGAVAVRLGLVTPAQIDEAVSIQMRSRPRPFLGAVLVELGYLTPRTLCKVLDAQASTGGWQG
jgi:hypothetical protein